jgi:hypothetical protein
MWDEAVEFLKKHFKPEPIHHEVDGRSYKVRPGQFGPALDDLIVPPVKPALQLVSLTGFADTFKADLDTFSAAGRVAVHVSDHLNVSLISLEGDKYGRRHTWLTATCKETNPFPFDQYQLPEAFLLSLQAGFLPTENVVQLQLLASTLSSDSSIATQDDGFTQTVTVKQGSVSRGDAVLPKRIKLMPYRTFREVDPIESEFILRLKGKPGELPTIALLQVDAGKWKHDTQLVVKKWLAKHLPEGTTVVA